MTDVVIVSAARTPVGSFLGALSSLPASKLGEIAIKAALERAGVSGDEVDEVILGHVLQAAAGQGPARQAAVGAGVRKEAAAWSLNQICGSGLRAVAIAAQQIALGDAKIVVAGGQESMSQAPHAQQLRNGHKMGDVALIDTMVRDGLWDAFNGYHMGQTAENIAEKWSISREAQDEFGLASQHKAEAAQNAGKFDEEITPVVIPGKKGDVTVDKDEYIRHGATLELMQKLIPAFTKDGSVTAANASGLNDGAAALVLMSADEAKARGLSRWPASPPTPPPASIRRSWGPARSRRRRRRWRGRAGTFPIWIWSSPTRPSPPRACAWSRSWVSTRPRSTSTAAPSPSGTPSAPRARAS